EILKCERMNLYMNFDRMLSKYEIKILKEFIHRRISHEPIQYILGKASFFGSEFIVCKSVLIPRPETELLVQKILEDIKDSGKKEVSVFEIGAGTGCISIAVAKGLEKINIGYEIFSIDRSKDAIKNAEQNQKLNAVNNKKLKFYCKDVFDIDKLNKSFDYIVSNPPYISNELYIDLPPEIKDNEPDLALTDFGDGLEFYKRILMIASDEKFSGKVFCEIGYGQKNKIEMLLKKNNFSQYFFLKDYNNINRILIAKK
ncbi:MAG: peptide chain release factor N(5)-glutamine methyltransferase, partial [bacterium]